MTQLSHSSPAPHAPHAPPHAPPAIHPTGPTPPHAPPAKGGITSKISVGLAGGAGLLVGILPNIIDSATNLGLAGITANSFSELLQNPVNVALIAGAVIGAVYLMRG